MLIFASTKTTISIKIMHAEIATYIIVVILSVLINEMSLIKPYKKLYAKLSGNTRFESNTKDNKNTTIVIGKNITHKTLINFISLMSTLIIAILGNPCQAIT